MLRASQKHRLTCRDGDASSALKEQRRERELRLGQKSVASGVPYKAIALATILFLIGSLLIIIGALLLSGYIDVTNHDRTWPVLIIGILVFLPGFYHLRIAYYASKGYRGYSYEDIPDFD
ncbi:Transmembrane protein 230 [Acipenser ruthenus]|uniref:Transmembrane protein 230 n=1 Tax=Acipenser ruthenus TaxID=7906 RepID=A0A444UCP2_ACIRT|nr:Transmembrane protein 230 [Acipenser ruthenus]